MNKSLLDYITNDGQYAPFGVPETDELKGRSALLPDGSKLRFDGELAIKCDDDLFLAERQGRLLLIKEHGDESLTAFDTAEATAGASALPASLEGWATDFCMAAGYVLTAVFKDGSLSLSPSPEPTVGSSYETGSAGETPKAPDAPLVRLAIKAVEIDEKRFILRFPEIGDIVILNARRFLLYTISQGRIAAGFVEIPAKD